MNPIIAWVLVIVIGTEPSNYQVWPGGTMELLSRRSQSFVTKTDCDNARLRALTNASRQEARYPKGQYPYEPVVTAFCVPIQKPKPKSSRNPRP